MDESRPDLPAYRFSRALEDWSASELMLKESLYRACIHHAYGTIFHAMRAVLAFNGFLLLENTSVLSCFFEHFSGMGDFGGDSKKMVSEALHLLEMADSEDFYEASREEAEEQLAAAGVFMEMAGKYLKEKDVLLI